VIADSFDAIDRAVATGTTVADFKKEMGPKLEAEWAGSVANPAARMDTIFRTNVMDSYGSGRWRQAQDPAVRAMRPYVRYDVVDDERTSEICAPLVGLVLPADDPFVRSHCVPLHHNCRTSIVTLTQEEAEEEGIAEEAPDADAAEGFGDPPDTYEDAEIPDWLQAKRDDYPDELRDAAAAKGLFGSTPEEE
jgi:SPP1 gp7 family putative phage head morphogenesis protein